MAAGWIPEAELHVIAGARPRNRFGLAAVVTAVRTNGVDRKLFFCAAKSKRFSVKRIDRDSWNETRHKVFERGRPGAAGQAIPFASKAR